MTRDSTLQEALEQGVYDHWNSDVCCTLDTITATEPSTPIYCCDLVGEPSDSGAVRVDRDLEIKYFEEMGMSEKVPVPEAKSNGTHVLGARWVDVRKRMDQKDHD